MKNPPTAARKTLESFVNAGVHRHDIYSALSQAATRMGDDAAAVTYAVAAASAAPTVALYHLNAGILSDRLQRRAEAVAYYGQFLDLSERNPVLNDAPIASIRERARYLAAQL